MELKDISRRLKKIAEEVDVQSEGLRKLTPGGWVNEDLSNNSEILLGETVRKLDIVIESLNKTINSFHYFGSEQKKLQRFLPYLQRLREQLFNLMS